MHELYQLDCNSKGITPEKYHTYKNIFNFEFNLGFHVPKNDRCDICEEYESNSKIDKVSDELKQKYEAHELAKQLQRLKGMQIESRKKLFFVFDMQNVIACPRVNVSNFFYKRKLNVFNLTAHLSLNKCAYNAMWSEHQAGRGANEITSALVKILEKVLEDYPLLESITLWSDSCIPQNSAMVTALKHFMQNHPILKTIEQKFSEPGHSQIQEVDCVQSYI